jgi:hypothetical protein
MRTLRSTAVMAVVVGLLLGTALEAGSEPAPYSIFSLRGTYHLTFTGVSVTTGQLQTGIGIFVADGTGKLTGTEVVNRGIVCNLSVTATYAINPNGTGTLNATFTGATPGCSGTFNSALLLSEGGAVVRAISTDPDFVTFTEEWRRQLE